jgi:hypothetical protein
MTVGIVLRGYESDVNREICVALLRVGDLITTQNGPTPRFNPPAPGRPVPHKFLIRLWREIYESSLGSCA